MARVRARYLRTSTFRCEFYEEAFTVSLARVEHVSASVRLVSHTEKTANCFPLLYAIVGTIMRLIALKRTAIGGKQSLSTDKGFCRGERLERKPKFQIV